MKNIDMHNYFADCTNAEEAAHIVLDFGGSSEILVEDLEIAEGRLVVRLDGVQALALGNRALADWATGWLVGLSVGKCEAEPENDDTPRVRRG